MGKLLRATQKIFGSSAGSNELAKFGSYAASSPIRYDGATVSPSLVQSLSNFLTGWFAETVGLNAPALEDWNAICYLFSYQLAYLLQTGISEWDANVTYYIGSVVSSGSVIYVSKTNTNLNHAVTDGTNWSIQRQTIGTSSAPIPIGGATPAPIANGGNQDIYLVGNRGWISETAAGALLWWDVCWSPVLSQFIAVAASAGGNSIMYSADGVSWFLTTPPELNAWRGVCWAGAPLNYYCAVSTAGTNQVMVSADGITWNPQTASTAQPWNGICFADSIQLFVAVGGSGTLTGVMTSPDAVTWTTQATPGPSTWTRVCFSPDLLLFVAVGLAGAVMTSPDGVTWTSRTAANVNDWNGVCWSPELHLFVAVSPSAGLPQIMTSPDGVTWTARTAPTVNGYFDVCWAPDFGVFRAVGASTNMVSADGITWVTETAPQSNSWGSVCYAPALQQFVAVATFGTQRVEILKPSIVTNVPAIAAGVTNGQRITIIGGSLYVPPILNADSSVQLPTSPLMLKKNKTLQMFWDAGQSKWFPVTT